MSHKPGPRLNSLLVVLAQLLEDIATLTADQKSDIQIASEDPKNLAVLVALGYEAEMLQKCLEAVTQTVDKVEFTKLISHALFFMIYADGVMGEANIPPSMLAMTAKDMTKSENWADVAPNVLKHADSMKSGVVDTDVGNSESNHVGDEPTSDMFGVTTVSRLGLKGKVSDKAN